MYIMSVTPYIAMQFMILSLNFYFIHRAMLFCIYIIIHVVFTKVLWKSLERVENVNPIGR